MNFIAFWHKARKYQITAIIYLKLMAFLQLGNHSEQYGISMDEHVTRWVGMDAWC